ncbi:MAG: GNAT family N-acetyltransferase, partial [Mycobacteriales bacterium]
MDPVEISAGTLHLRPWNAYDEEVLLALFQDPDVVRWTPAPVPFTTEDARARLAGTWPALWENETGGAWAVLDSTTAEVLGWVAVFGRKDGVAEVGWAAMPAGRGRGVTSAAVAAVCRWARAVLDVDRLEAVIAVGNWASRAVAEKCGFTVEGVRRHGMQQRGARLDCWVASLLADDDLVDRRPLPALPDLCDGVVRLRRWTGADADVVQRACDDPLTARWLPVPSPYPREAALGWLEGMVVPEWGEGRVASVAVVDATSGEVLGDVGLTLADRPPGVGEVGYWTA